MFALCWASVKIRCVGYRRIVSQIIKFIIFLYKYIIQLIEIKCGLTGVFICNGLLYIVGFMHDFVCNSTKDMNRNATLTLVHLSDTEPHTSTCLKCLLFKCQTIPSPDTLPTSIFSRNKYYYHTRSCYIYCYSLFIFEIYVFRTPNYRWNYDF